MTLLAITPFIIYSCVGITAITLVFYFLLNKKKNVQPEPLKEQVTVVDEPRTEYSVIKEDRDKLKAEINLTYASNLELQSENKRLSERLKQAEDMLYNIMSYDKEQVKVGQEIIGRVLPNGKRKVRGVITRITRRGNAIIVDSNGKEYNVSLNDFVAVFD